MAEGEYGADRWVDTHRETVAHLEELVAILDDPNVPDGTIIQISERGRVDPIEDGSAKVANPAPLDLPPPPSPPASALAELAPFDI